MNEEYWGLVVKLQIVCKSVGIVEFEKSFFLFKTKGRHIGKRRNRREKKFAKLELIN